MGTDLDCRQPYKTLNLRYDVVAPTLTHLDRIGNPDFRDHIDEMVRGNDLVELGAAGNPLEVLFGFSPTGYVCVEPTNHPSNESSDSLPDFVKYVPGDGLPYLEGISDSIQGVVSAGLMDGFILDDEDYRTKLIEAIFQAMGPGGMTMHTFNSGIEQLFLLAGFEFVFGCNAWNTDSGIDHVLLTEDMVERGYTAGESVKLSTILFRKPEKDVVS